jgi:glycosyltransferase involved in cell wall biosynthesis
MKKNMNNIAIDVNPLVHGSRAVRRCTACLVSELLNHNAINYNLLCFDNKSNTKNYLTKLPYGAKKKIIPIPYRFLVPFWKKFSWPKIETIIPGCDILYTNEFYFPPAKNALVLATIHGLAYKIIPEKISPRFVQIFNQGLLYILKHADYLISVSETTKKELITHVGVSSHRIYVVTHGVDKQFRKKENVQEVRDQLKKKYGLIRPYILYVGAIGIHKNIMGILTAYQKLFHKVSHDLVMVGPPDSAWDSANRFVYDCGLSKNVHFLGHVHKTDDLSEIYNGADLFVFPSFYEGWTSPPLEAMACGTPVITSNCSSLPETVGNAAILIDPNNTETLAHEMERVLANKTLQSELIKKGLVHVRSHTWEKAAKKLNEVFADIMMRGPWERKVNESCN